jgi:hypothetical protein
MQKVVWLGLVAVCGVSACARTRVETTIRPDLIGSKYARVTGYMATRGAAPGGRHTEETPGDIQHDVIRDEATLARVTPTETCVDVVVRTDRTHDEPLDQLAPTFEIDGKEAKAIVENEMVSVFDYNFTGRVETVAIEGVAATQYIGMSVTEPAEKIFRVVERRGTVCVPQGGQVKEVALDLTHPYWNVADYNYHLVFAWKIS